jgi:hypothetical protein
VNKSKQYEDQKKKVDAQYDLMAAYGGKNEPAYGAITESKTFRKGGQTWQNKLQLSE